MSFKVEKLALYTTIYPKVAAFLPGWYRSVQAQTDQNFRLWIGLDGIAREVVEEIIGTRLQATWVSSQPGDTPALIRQRSLEQIVKKFEAVVLVDSDDVLRESRVAAAREALKDAELAGCCLNLVDQNGKEMGQNFNLPLDTMAEDVLPRHNVFGFSNTAYRTELLQRCLPISKEVVLVDWFLATKAWLFGARLTFDRVARMGYRQYESNMARVKFPVGAEQVVADTGMVRHHFQFILAEDSHGFLPDRLLKVVSVAANIEQFYEHVVNRPYKLQSYVEELNSLQPAPLWWTSVAHPQLESMWRATT